MVWKTLSLAALVGVALVFGCGAARASPTASNQPVQLAVQGVGRVVSSGGTGLPAGPLADLLQSRNYAASGTGPGSVLLRDLLTKAPGPNGAITATAVRAVPWSAIAKGVGRAVPLVGTALTIKDLLDSVRCREKFGGGNECDDGQPEVERLTYCTGVINVSGNAGYPGVWGQTVCGTSGAALAAAVSAKISADAAPVISMSCTVSSSCSGELQRDGYRAPFSVSVGPPSSTLACPAIVVNGVEVYPAKGPDGQCPTLQYAPKTDEQVGAKVEQHGDKGKAVAAAKELDKAAVPMEHPAPTFDVPPVVQGERQRIEHPDGSVTIRDPSWELTPKPDGYGWVPKLVETTYPPGATIPPQGEPPTQPGTTTTGGPTEFKGCGLPDSPPCKIDEGGTPVAGDLSGPTAVQEGARDSIIEKINAPVTLPWLWVFDLPAGACVNPTIPGDLVPGVGEQQFNICGSPYMAWWRSFWAWLLGVLAGWYAWRRYSDAVGSR